MPSAFCCNVRCTDAGEIEGEPIRNVKGIAYLLCAMHACPLELHR